MQAAHITTKVVNSSPAHGEVYSIQHYVIKFVSDFLQVGGFPISSTNKTSTDHHDITELLLKVALDTIATTLSWCIVMIWFDLIFGV